MATYANRGNRYRVRWRDPGVDNPRSFSVPDEQSAKEFAAEASRCEARGEPWVPPPDRVAPLARQPLVDLAVEWLEEVKRTARPATVMAYADSVTRFIEFAGAQIGRVPVLNDFAPDLVRRWDGVQQEGGLAVHTRRSRYAALSSWAGWLEGMHPDLFRAAPIRAIKMPKAPKARPLALSWREVDAILELMTSGAHVAAMIQRCTGLRRGEIVRLRWRDVDVAQDGVTYVDLPDDITKGGQAGRRVPLASVLGRFLAQLRAQPRKPTADDRIVRISPESYGAMTTTAIRKAAALGLCRTDAVKVRSSTHLFRKAFVSNLRRAGADADAVEQLVGHDIGVRRHYLDLDALMLAAVQCVPEIGLRGEPFALAAAAVTR